MSIPRTPDFTSPIRPLYEEAFSSGDMITQYVLELDTVVEKLQAAILSDRYTPEEKGTALREATALAKQAISNATKHKHNNFTDFYRLCNSATFIRQRILLPILFRTDMQDFRENQMDGLKGESVELIAGLLEAYNLLRFKIDSEERRNIRGAIQEGTMTALLNDAQDGQFAVLPASYHEDVYEGIDAYAHFVAENGESYYSAISFKSTRQDAIQAKRRQPHLVVLCAQDIDNLDLVISRLLVKQHEGYPGITEKEEEQLEAARVVLYEQFCQQVSESAKPVSMNLPAASLMQLHDIA